MKPGEPEQSRKLLVDGFRLSRHRDWVLLYSPIFASSALKAFSGRTHRYRGDNQYLRLSFVWCKMPCGMFRQFSDRDWRARQWLSESDYLLISFNRSADHGGLDDPGMSIQHCLDFGRGTR